jgi:hypothetical protein
MRSGHEPVSFSLIGGEHRGQAGRRQVLPELGPRASVAIPGTLDARGDVVPGERRECHRMLAEHAVLPVVGRHDVEQPAHRRPLEVGGTGRVHALRPARWNLVRCHQSRIGAFEQVF